MKSSRMVRDVNLIGTHPDSFL